MEILITKIAQIAQIRLLQHQQMQEDDFDMEQFEEVEGEDSQEMLIQEVQPLKSSNQILSGKIKDFFNKQLKNDGIKLESYFPFAIKTGVKSVCAKQITRAETIVECYECRTDGSCIICLECFQNGNHEGHKYVIKKASGGCCDCGDSEAWKVEGFCKNHSGKVIDVEVDTEEQKKFAEVFSELFNFYFKLLDGQIGEGSNFFSKIIRYLLKLNKDSLYYNQMTTNMLDLKIARGKNNTVRSIIGHLLNFQNKMTSTMLNQLFLCMFPYYKFKQLLLFNYFKYYILIYKGDQQSWEAGSSISCQLLTSYQLVEDCVKRDDCIPIGEKVKIKKSAQKTFNLCLIILNNFDMITNLKRESALSYFQFHIRKGFNSLFLFYQKIKDSQKSMVISNQQNPQLYLLNTLIQYTQLQLMAIQKFVNIVGIIRQDYDTLSILLKQIYAKVTKEQDATSLIIFKPYERAFSVVLFCMVGMNLQNCNDYTIKRILQVLQTTKQNFQLNCAKILKRMMKTFFYYNEVICSPGLSSTLQHYLYFYKQKSKLLMFLDILLIKQLTLIADIQPVISFDTLTTQIQNPKKHLQTSIFMIQSLNLMYVSKIYQMFVAHALTSCKTNLYQKELEVMFIKILVSIGGSFSKTQMKQISDNFFHRQLNLVECCFKNYCKFEKDKKTFILNSEYQKFEGLNFNDFRTTFQNKQQLQQPNKTSDLIQDYNKIILKKVWTEETTKKCIKLFHQIQSNLFLEQKFKALLYQFKCIHFILKKLQIQTFNLIEGNIFNITSIQQIMPLLTSNKGVDNQTMNEQTQQKKKAQNAKLLKMNEIREKQKKFSQKMEIEAPSIRKTIDIEENNIVCSICKNEKPDQFVYLSYLKIANFEKTFQDFTKGNGVSTLSFTSCYHIVDYLCIKKHIQSNTKQVFKCPVCRQQANMFLPFQQNKKLSQILLKRISMVIRVIFTSKFNILEEILKSFYHYCLLSICDFSYTIKKRLIIYKSLFKMFKAVASEKQLQKLQSQFQKRQFKNMEQDKTKTLPNVNIFQNFLQFFRESVQQRQQEWQDDDDDDSENEQQEVSNIKKQSNKIQEKKIPIQNQYHKYFEYVINKVLSKLLNRQIQYPLQSTQDGQIMLMALKYLFDEQDQVEQLVLSKNKSVESNPEKYIKLRQLPTRYTPLGKIVKCSFCNKMSPSLFMCLLCNDWIACANCEKQNINSHADFHGSKGLFLDIRRAKILSRNNNLQIQLGTVYKDQFGKDFNIKLNWEQFELDLILLREIYNLFIHDQMIDTKKM